MANSPNYNIRGALLTILNGMAPDPHHDADIVHLCHLIAWFREGAIGSDFEIERRFIMVVEALERSSDLRLQVKGYLEQFLKESRYRYTFAELGILGNETFGQAMKNRIFQRLLPATVEDKTVRESLSLVFTKSSDHEWLERISVPAWKRFFSVMDWLNPAMPLWIKIQHEMLEATEMLAVRIAAAGIDSEVVRCLGIEDRHTSPFVEQLLELRSLIGQSHEKLGHGSSLEDLGDHLDVLLDQCTAQIKKAYAQARLQGISVTLSMQLIRLEQSIARMQTLLQLLGALPAEDRAAGCVRFFCLLTREENRKHSIGDLWTSMTDKLALRITEHASKTGEKYATETRSEYWGMAKAAMGAGVIVGFMALIKVGLGALHLPPLWQAVAFSLNYGLGFVLIHILKFTIATKQPAMTAARIAAAIESANGKLGSVERIVELIVQVARTQFVAIVGNVIVAFLTAMAIGFAWLALFGAAPVNPDKAQHMLDEIHPLWSAAIPHAAIAGVFLFTAGVISGYYDNLCIYHRLPDRLRKVVWLRKWLGVVRLNRLADYLAHNTGALAGNFFFGCMLGSAGFVGLMLGLPIDIRHITFAAANLAYATHTFEFQLAWEVFMVSLLGVLAIGMTNLAVSFSLAFFTALKARGVRPRGSAAIGRRLLRRLLETPGQFFYPPKVGPSVAAPLNPVPGKSADEDHNQSTQG
ncbi:MAG TPA: recombinase [Limnobacter sp.]|nr:recombinase [Limnobacter sp.]